VKFPFMVCLQKKYHIPVLAHTVRYSAQSLNFDDAQLPRCAVFRQFVPAPSKGRCHFFGSAPRFSRSH
jgi:hypothetical protein